MNKRDLLKSAAATLLAGTMAQKLPAQRKNPAPGAGHKQFNLLFITVDDMDWSVAGFMGGKGRLTPHLDALAASSHRFVNNRTVAPICMPSREAFMSGLLPHHSGGTGFTPIREGLPTLTTLLQHQGYFAAAIHKVDHMQPYSCFPWDYIQQGKDRHTLIHAQGMHVAMEEARAQSRPFFIQCNINDPHRPFYGSEAALKMDHGNEGAYAIEREVKPEEVTIPPMLEDLPDIRTEIAQYWNSVQRMDKAIGHILRMLEESGEASNTAVIFCADHGMPFPFSKATCYDHGTRVPVLIRWPGMEGPRQFDQLTSNVDILPTLLELLDVPPPKDLDGRSWIPLIRGKPTQYPEFQFTYVNQVSSGMAYPMRAVQDRRYSLVFSSWSNGKLALRLESMSGLTFTAMERAAKDNPVIAARVKQYVYGIPLALYDLRSDPGQRHNLISDKRHAARATRMQQALLVEMERTIDPELNNFRACLAGKPMSVPQNPAKYRLGGD